jgi:hypothetical protein
MKLSALPVLASLSLLGSAHAASLYASGGSLLADGGAPASGFAVTGSSEGVGTWFTLARRSTVERIVFGSSLDAAALDPLSHRVLPSIQIFSGDWSSFLGTSDGLEGGATVVAGPDFNRVIFQVRGTCAGCSLVLEAGTYRIDWAHGESLMPTYSVPGESVVLSNPFNVVTLAGTSLDFDVQGVSAVPEPAAWALMAAGLAGLATRRQRAAGRRVSR